jgi:TPP-dependent pyruvate/acetoin dehydrogenase alpha subunit
LIPSGHLRFEGYCGKGGSMHIADQDKGNLGANAIVGAGAGIATGAALSAKRLGRAASAAVSNGWRSAALRRGRA